MSQSGIPDRNTVTLEPVEEAPESGPRRMVLGAALVDRQLVRLRGRRRRRRSRFGGSPGRHRVERLVVLPRDERPFLAVGADRVGQGPGEFRGHTGELRAQSVAPHADRALLPAER